MDIKQMIKVYIPYDEEEQVMKESFLKFLDAFGDNIWTRDNLIGHICASAWVINKDKTKSLMAYHNIFDSWAWLGGHADGEMDLLSNE